MRSTITFWFTPRLGRADGTQNNCAFGKQREAFVGRYRHHTGSAILRRFAGPQRCPFVRLRRRQQGLRCRAELLLLAEIHEKETGVFRLIVKVAEAERTPAQDCAVDRKCRHFAEAWISLPKPDQIA